jgi:hypothetical protein
MPAATDKSRPEATTLSSAGTSAAERAARKLDRVQEQLRKAKARQRVALDERASTIGYALIEAMRRDSEFKADVLQCLDGTARAELLSIFSNGNDRA